MNLCCSDKQFAICPRFYHTYNEISVFLCYQNLIMDLFVINFLLFFCLMSQHCMLQIDLLLRPLLPHAYYDINFVVFLMQLEDYFSCCLLTLCSSTWKYGANSFLRIMVVKLESLQIPLQIDHRRAYNCEIMLSKVKIPLHDLLVSCSLFKITFGVQRSFSLLLSIGQLH